MNESDGDRIDIGDVSHSDGIATGRESSASSAKVTINQAEPGLRDMIRMLWVQSLTDDLDRKDRQGETDRWRASMTDRIDRIDTAIRYIAHSIYWLRAAGAALAVVVALLLVEFGRLIGWW